MIRPVADARPHYLPAVSVRGDLTTFTYNGFFHALAGREEEGFACAAETSAAA